MQLVCARLGQDLRLVSAASNSPPMRRGESGAAVRLLQQALADLGERLPNSFRAGDFDGIFGSETEAALRGFQSKRGLAADGIAGRQTLGSMDQIFQQNDPFFSLPEVEEAILIGRMMGPVDQRPFSCTSKR